MSGKIESTPAASTNCRKRGRESPSDSVILTETPEFSRPMVKRRYFGRQLIFEPVAELEEAPKAETRSIEKAFVAELGIDDFSEKIGKTFKQAARFFARDVVNDLVAKFLLPESTGMFMKDKETKKGEIFVNRKRVRNNRKNAGGLREAAFSRYLRKSRLRTGNL